MAISLKHKFANPKSDTPDATVARASDWNDEHDMTLAANRVLGRKTAGTGSVEELTGADVRAIADVEQAGVGVINTRTSSYTLALSDRGKVIEMDVATANTVTVPNEVGLSGVDFPIGTRITIIQRGLGVTTLLPATGVTVQSSTGELSTLSRYSSLVVYKRGANQWAVVDQQSAYLEARMEAIEVLSGGYRYLGARSSDPVNRLDGSALQAGDLYFNTTNDRMRVYEVGTGWIDYEATAQAAATTATAQASSATASATSASNSAATAASASSASTVAKVAAEAARDAAQLSAGVYVSTAAGLAAVAEDAYFSVPSASNAEYLILYKKVSGVAVEVSRYPSARQLDNLFNAQRAVANSLDLSNDFLSPFFVNTWDYTRSSGGGVASPVLVTISSRDSDTTFTVATGGGGNLPGFDGAIVVKDGTTGRYTGFGVIDKTGDVITVNGTLPANPTECQWMHDAINGQHLSPAAYNGLADFICDAVQKYSYKKYSPIAYYHPVICNTPAFNNANIYNLTNAVQLWAVTKLGTAGGGGFVSGYGNLLKLCQTDQGNTNITQNNLSKYLPRSYIIQDAVAGNGIEITIPVGKLDGFIEVPFSASRVSYVKDSVTYYTDGRAKLEILGDGVTSILTEYSSPNGIRRAFVGFGGYNTLVLRLTCADNLASSISLHGFYAYAKSPETPTTGYFKTGDRIAFLGDSWTQFPSPLGGQTPPLRADGSSAEGMCHLSERLRTRLAADGITVTTLNMGKGGTTSAWGLYWLDAVIALKPTHCVLCFFTNDNNSRSAAAGTADSAWDFDPASMWAWKVQSAGGRKGAVTTDQWFDNMRTICERLAVAGIKPIVLMPGMTASSAQSQTVQQQYLSKMAVGFNNINKLGGGS